MKELRKHFTEADGRLPQGLEEDKGLRERRQRAPTVHNATDYQLTHLWRKATQSAEAAAYRRNRTLNRREQTAIKEFEQKAKEACQP